jgi:predicted small integral membrane protein
LVAFLVKHFTESELALVWYRSRAKVWEVVGLTIGFSLWFFGFMVIAEYFAMWQSKAWNAQEAAFRIAAVILGVLVFVSLPDGDVA